MSKRIVIGFGALAILAGSVVGWGEVAYSITSLGTLPGYTDSSLGTAVNDQGVVVGGSGSGIFTPFVWTPATGLQNLGIPAGYSAATAVGINDRGQVAVRATRYGQFPGLSSNFTARAFRWDSGVYTDLGTLGGVYSDTAGIDSSGRVAGTAYTSNFDIHAYRSTGNSLADIDSLGGNYSLGYGIDAAGDVVGEAYTADHAYHAFLWPGSGRMQDLGTLGGGQSTAFAISHSGQYILGIAQDAGGVTRTLLWHAGEKIVIGSFVDPASVNDTGEVVGAYSVAGGGGHAFVWDATLGMRDLNDLLNPAARANWTLTRGSQVNDSGEIVGEGTYNGTAIGFVLTPVPEPSGGVLGAAILCFVRRR